MTIPSPRALIQAAALFSALVLGAAACDERPAPTSPDPMPQPTPSAPAPAPEPAPAPAPLTAEYRVTFDATWSVTSHPQDPPDDPHFSPLIGATHSASVVLWRTGELASPGIQRMAETGSTTPLDTEITAIVNLGAAQAMLRGSGLSDSPGTTSIEFTASQAFPLVTLVTMVAPRSMPKFMMMTMP